MNNEIKEILFLLHNDRLTDSGKRKLEDYITNLQEEKESWRRVATNNFNNSEDYKTRNEKAIEYINENKHLSMFADCREPEEDWNYDLEIDPRDLLNILQGKSDE